MRTGLKPQIVNNTDGLPTVLSFGADWVAEHEWGIQPLRNAFGVDSEQDGLARRIVRKTPEHLSWRKIGDYGGFTTVSAQDYVHPTNTLYTAWDERDLAAFSNDPAHIETLRVFYDALRNNNAAIWLGGGEFLENPGLCIGIADRIPTGTSTRWLERDRFQRTLTKSKHT